MTAQETYEYIRAFFLKQGELARAKNEVADGYRCFYRSAEGLKCAVGCLISDELYDSIVPHPFGVVAKTTIGDLIENQSVGAILNYSPQLKEIVNGDDLEGQRKLAFLTDAQLLHDDDTTENVADFINKLDVLALDRGLLSA